MSKDNEIQYPHAMEMDHATATHVPLDSDKVVREVLSRPVRNHTNYYSFNQTNEENKLFTGVVLGELIAYEDKNKIQRILVNFPGNPYTTPLQALTTVKVHKNDLGKQVVLSFDKGNPSRPIIMGLIQQPQATSEIEIDIAEDVKKHQMEANIDGKQVTLTADKEIVLKCGKSSITMTRAGKIIIKGEYLLSRASGANKIKGGSVQIN